MRLKNGASQQRSCKTGCAKSGKGPLEMKEKRSYIFVYQIVLIEENGEFGKISRLAHYQFTTCHPKSANRNLLNSRHYRHINLLYFPFSETTPLSEFGTALVLQHVAEQSFVRAELLTIGLVGGEVKILRRVMAAIEWNGSRQSLGVGPSGGAEALEGMRLAETLFGEHVIGMAGPAGDAIFQLDDRVRGISVRQEIAGDGFELVIRVVGRYRSDG